MLEKDVMGAGVNNAYSCTKCKSVSFYPIIQDIQHLPWESIPMLYDHPVTRVPSLQFLLSKVNMRYFNNEDHDTVNPGFRQF